MKNILYKKFMPIMALFMAIILLFSSNVFANYSFNVGGEQKEVADFNIDNIMNNSDYKVVYNNYILFTVTGSDVRLLCFDDTVVPFVYYDNNFIRFTSTVDSTYYNYDYEFSSSKWYAISSSSITENSSTYFSRDGYILYSTFDVKDSNGNVVFQGAPQEEIAERTLAMVVEQIKDKINPLAGVREVLLITILVLVSIIAIWKAIKLLRKELKTF